MEVIQVKTETLKASDYNPRQWTDTEKETLKKSIQEFGLVDPLIVNSAPERQNVVIGGHFRLAVAREMGITEVPVVFLDIPSLEKEKELNLRLNRNHGEWDWNLLKQLFAEAQLLELGFTQGELGLLEQKLKEEVDQDRLKDSIQSYLEGNIRQIVLYLSAEQFENLIPRLQKVSEKDGTENHTETFLKAFEMYEHSLFS